MNMLIEKINRLQALRDMMASKSLIDNAIDDIVKTAPNIVNGLIDRGDRNWATVQKLSEEVNHLEEGLTQANINLHDRDCRLADMEVTINSLKDKLAFENGIIFNNGNVVKIDATAYQSVIDQNKDLKDELRQAQKNSIFLNTRINNQASEIETLNRDNKGLTILNGQQADMIRRYRGDTEMLGIENADLNNEISGKDCLIEKQVGIIDRLTDENGRLADKNANQASMIRGYRADVDTLKIKLDASQKNVSIHMDIVGDQARQIRVLKNDLSICRGQMEMLQGAVPSFQNTIKQQGNKIVELGEYSRKLEGVVENLNQHLFGRSM